MHQIFAMMTGEAGRYDGSRDRTGAGSGLAAILADELLDAVESGSTPDLLDVLSRIALIDPAPMPGATGVSPDVDEERERLELLRAVAVQLRLDLHAMLMHIYQRIEASRGYLEVVRHLAGRDSAGGAKVWNPLPGVAKPPATPEDAGVRQEFGGSAPDGEI